MQDKQPAVRSVYLDALRLLCSFLVIVNHTYDYVRLSDCSSLVRFASFSSLSFSKIAVPIFLMISGCTLLTKEDDLKKTFSRFMRIALALVVFSFAYELYRYFSGQLESLSIKRFLLSIYEQHTTTSYWYLYAYLGLLLMLPFLQKLVHVMHTQDFLLYFSIFIFFFGFWPLVVEYTSLSAYNEKFSLPLFTPLLSYMLLGYFIHIHPSYRLPGALCLLLPAVSALLCGAATNHAFEESGGMRYLFLDNIALLPVILSSLCMFLFFRRLRFRDRTARIIRLLGSASFGVYLVADLFISLLFPVCVLLRAHLPPLAAVFLYQITIWLASLLTALALRRLPLLNRLL